MHGSIQKEVTCYEKMAECSHAYMKQWRWADICCYSFPFLFFILLFLFVVVYAFNSCY